MEGGHGGVDVVPGGQDDEFDGARATWWPHHVDDVGGLAGALGNGDDDDIEDVDVHATRVHGKLDSVTIPGEKLRDSGGGTAVGVHDQH